MHKLHRALSEVSTRLKETSADMEKLTVLSSRHNHEEVCGKTSLVADHAYCFDDTIVLSSHDAQASRLDVLRVDQMNLSHVTSFDAKGEVTCLGLFKTSLETCIAVGSVGDGMPYLTIYSLDGRELCSKAPQPYLGRFSISMAETRRLC